MCTSYCSLNLEVLGHSEWARSVREQYWILLFQNGLWQNTKVFFWISKFMLFSSKNRSLLKIHIHLRYATDFCLLTLPFQFWKLHCFYLDMVRPICQVLEKRIFGESMEKLENAFWKMYFLFSVHICVNCILLPRAISALLWPMMFVSTALAVLFTLVDSGI